MKNPFIFTLLFLLMPSAQASQDGKSLFESLCMSCHVVSGKPTIAPPIFGVKNHVIQAHPRRDDFIQYIVQWVKQPDASSSLMPGAVRRFGVMPGLPYSEEQVRKIAAFLYDTEIKMPGWYRKHYEAEHGKPSDN